MVMEARSATKLKLHAFFVFSIDGDREFSFRLQVHGIDGMDPKPSYNMVMTESPFPFRNQTHMQ